jgi:uroporphyrinogen decarboxylase
MTTRERVEACLEHRDPDRVPLDGIFRPEVWSKLKRHFGSESEDAIRDNLGIDFKVVVMDESEEFLSTAELAPDGTMLKPCGDGVYETEWGVRRRFHENSNYYGYAFCPLADESNLNTYRVPDLNAPGRFDRAAEQIKESKRDHFIRADVTTLFRHGWDLRGLEQWYEDLLLNPRFVEKLSDMLLEFKLEQVRRFAEMGVDILGLVGDISMKDNLMMPPDVWRRFFKSREIRLVEEGKKRGIRYFYFHSDGNLMPVMADLAEMGFNIVNPIQPECMDPEEVKRLFGERITLHGTISSQKTMPFGSVEDVRAEVRSRIEKLGSDGGLVLAPNNVVQYDVPLENLLAMYETAREGEGG